MAAREHGGCGRQVRLRVLYLSIGLFDKGGLSRYGRYQVSALRDLHGERNVVAMSLRGPDHTGFEEPFTVSYHADGFGTASQSAFFARALGLALKERPDVVWAAHLHLVPLGILLRPLTRRRRLIAGVYGEELWSGRRWFHRRSLPLANLVVSDCAFSADVVRKEYRIAHQRLRVVRDCVDTLRFNPQTPDRSIWQRFGVPYLSDGYYILTLGRLERRARYKGYDRLLDAVKAIGNQSPRLVTIIAGDGDDRERLQRRVQEQGLDGQVFFTGSVPEKFLNAVYNCCDLFVMVSERGEGQGEGLPLTPLEAAACAKPVIVGDEDGSREAAIDGVTGRIISPREPQALRNAIMSISTDRGLSRRMGEAGRRRIVENFGYDAFRDQTGAVLTSLT